MIDPLAEKYYSISPYAYVANNPLKYIDPDGMQPKDKIGLGISLKTSVGPQIGASLSIHGIEVGGVARGYNVDSKIELGIEMDTNGKISPYGKYEAKDVYYEVGADIGFFGKEKSLTKNPQDHPVFKEETATKKQGVLEEKTVTTEEGTTTTEAFDMSYKVSINLLIIGFELEFKFGER